MGDCLRWQPAIAVIIVQSITDVFVWLIPSLSLSFQCTSRPLHIVLGRGMNSLFLVNILVLYDLLQYLCICIVCHVNLANLLATYIVIYYAN